MSNTFDSIIVGTMKPLSNNQINLQSSIIPTYDQTINLGSNALRFNTIYCNQINVNNSVLDATDVIFFSFNDGSTNCIPLRFRFINKALAMISFEPKDLTLTPPSGYIISYKATLTTAESSILLSPVSPLWSRWQPNGSCLSCIPLVVDGALQNAFINWQPSNELVLEFSELVTSVDFSAGFSKIYTLNAPVS